MISTRTLAAAAALILLTTVVAAQTPQRGGTLIYGLDAEPPNYDCQGTTTFVEMQTVGTHYSRLVKFDPDHYPDVKPDLADSWTISPDQLTYNGTGDKTAMLWGRQKNHPFHL